MATAVPHPGAPALLRALLALVAGLLVFIAPVSGTAQVLGQPNWAQLSPERQAVLKPLAGEWDKLDNTRRRHWIALADRYREMAPEEQKRAQSRMVEWARLTPEQRRIARDNFRKAQELPPERKVTEWQDYQALAPIQKKKLTAAAEAQKPAVQKAQKREAERKSAAVTQRPSGKRSERVREANPLAGPAQVPAATSAAPVAITPPAEEPVPLASPATTQSSPAEKAN
ncbi:MAG: DUF3106 domain-containing protein [Burkholderiales bacterium]|nr:DUF3106 domain-containing protein [Burkholderiales bacterium]